MFWGIYCACLVIIFYFLKPMGPIPADPTDAEAVKRNILGTLRFQQNYILRLVEEWRAKHLFLELACWAIDWYLFIGEREIWNNMKIQLTGKKFQIFDTVLSLIADLWFLFFPEILFELKYILQLYIVLRLEVLCSIIIDLLPEKIPRHLSFSIYRSTLYVLVRFGRNNIFITQHKQFWM